jgi:hypothetical protein
MTERSSDTARLRRTAPLRDGSSLLPLLAPLWPLLDLTAPAPTALPPSTQGTSEALLAREAHTPCPYNGGPREIQRLRWDDGARTLRVEWRDEAWVGPSLSVSARGPAPWLDALTAVIDAYLATWEA